jgi:hypothetical protein
MVKKTSTLKCKNKIISFEDYKKYFVSLTIVLLFAKLILSSQSGCFFSLSPFHAVGLEERKGGKSFDRPVELVRKRPKTN